MFGKHWTSAQAVVVDKRAVKSSGDGMVTVHEFVVDVTTAAGESFRAKAEEPRIAIDFMAPSIGQQVRVEYDPDSRKVRFDKDDPSLSVKKYRNSRTDHFQESLSQPAGTPVASDVGNLAAILQGRAGQAPFVQLDPSSPDAIALREALLRAMGGAPAAPDRASDDGVTP